MRYINLHNPFIVRITRPEQRIVAVGTTTQPCLRSCIRGNKSRFAAHFNCHVAEREAFTHRHLLNQRSGVLDSAIVSAINANPAHHFKRHILCIYARRKCSRQANVDGLGNAKPGPSCSIGYPDIGRTHAGRKGSEGAISTGMAISPNNDITRDYVTAFWHHLVADAFLQNADILLMSKSADIALQCCCCNSRRRHNMIEDNMRPAWIENAPATLMGQLAKCLNCQWGRGIMTHHTINIHHDRLALLYSSTQLVTKDFLS